MKKIYNKMQNLLKGINLRLHLFKNRLVEYLSINKKKSLYKDIKFKKEQTIEINSLWKNNGARKVTKKYHKLYQSINDHYDKNYFPDSVFFTKLEHKLNPIYISEMYSDKSITELLYSNVSSITIPKTIVVSSGNYLYDSNREIINFETAIKLIKQSDSFVIKPTVDGGSGKGVKMYDSQKLSTKDINDILLTYKKDYIIQEKIISHEKLSMLNSNSVNTIRLITYIKEGKVYIAPISLRMGVGDNHVDNIHSGGIVVGVTEDGYLKEWGYQLGYCDSKVKYKKHPTTGITFKNYKIPKMQEIISAGIELHNNTPHLGIVSWDLTINNKEQIVLVEGNYLGHSIWFPQIVNKTSFFGENTEYFIKLSYEKKYNNIISGQ